MSQPLVSICIPVYNGERYLQKCLESAISQTYSNIEILLVDDCSEDATVSLIELFDNARIRLLHNEENRGVAFSRNKCIEESEGEYIAWLDADDIALPERVEKQVQFLEQNKEFVMVGSWVNTINSESQSTGLWKFDLSPAEIPTQLLFQNYFAQSSVMIRKSGIGDLRYDENMKTAEDYSLWSKMISVGQLGNIQEPLVCYRLHEKNHSHTTWESEQHSAEKSVLLNNYKNAGLELKHKEVDLIHEIVFHSAEPSIERLSQFVKLTDKIATHDQFKVGISPYLNRVAYYTKLYFHRFPEFKPEWKIYGNNKLMMHHLGMSRFRFRLKCMLKRKIAS